MAAKVGYDGSVATNADPGATGWAIRDDVLRLRLVGHKTAFKLDVSAPTTIGAAEECAIRLDDSSGRVSRKHAVVERRGADWIIGDLESTNGIRQDGERRSSFALAAGVEIGIGGLKLVAESARSIELHALLARFLGWAPSRLSEVDRALQAVRDMANLRASLLLRGDGALLGVAQRIHQIALGPDRAMSGLGTGEDGLTAMGRALNGTLFLEAERLPKDIREVVVGLRLPDAAVRLVVGANTAEGASRFAALLPSVATLVLPAVAEREHELDRILESYGADAATQLGSPSAGLRPHDLAWIRKGVKTLADAEEVMLRVVAVRNFGVSVGAERLGITHGALGRYLRRRKIPP